MADKLTKSYISQAFFDLVKEMERGCGDWESLSETDEDNALKERILNIAKEKLNSKVNKNEYR